MNAIFGTIGKLRAHQGKRDALIELIRGSIDDMPGCLSYVTARDVADDDTIWVTEVWTDADSHKASLGIPAVRAAIERAMPLIAGFETRITTEPVVGIGLARNPG